MEEDHEMPEISTEIPEGYDAINLLIGYTKHGGLTSCEADEYWNQIDSVSFISEPDRYCFLVKQREKEIKKVSTFFLENGKITPAGEKKKEDKRINPVRGSW